MAIIQKHYIATIVAIAVVAIWAENLSHELQLFLLDQVYSKIQILLKFQNEGCVIASICFFREFKRATQHGHDLSGQRETYTCTCTFSGVEWDEDVLPDLCRNWCSVITDAQSGLMPSEFYVLGTSFGSLQADAGTSIYVIQRILGHKNVETTQIYADMSDETKRQSVDRITLKPKVQTLSVVKPTGTE